jgi:hypothetical protein
LPEVCQYRAHLHAVAPYRAHLHEITAKHTDAKPEIIWVGSTHQEHNGWLLIPDVEWQMKWWWTTAS